MRRSRAFSDKVESAAVCASRHPEVRAMQPFGCMRASKDGGCSSLLDPMWRSSGPSAFEARRPNRPGEHLRYYGAASGQEVRIGFPTTIQPRRIKMTNPDHTGTPAATEYATIYLVFELSKATWKLGLLLPGSKKLSRYA